MRQVLRKSAGDEACGLDEAGRGALAGPLVAAAVKIPCSLATINKLSGINVRDGKLLSSGQRKKIYHCLKKIKAEIIVEIISVRQINTHGIGWANKEIFRRLIKAVEAHSYIVDGNLHLKRIHIKNQRVQCIVNADATITPVMLAGIVAKVERDEFMQAIHEKFPMYFWCQNKGYGTRKHIEAIKIYGTSPFHRSVFVATAIQKTPRYLAQYRKY